MNAGLAELRAHRWVYLRIGTCYLEPEFAREQCDASHKGAADAEDIYFHQKTTSLRGSFKNSNFFVSARKHRAQNRSVYGIHEDSSTELTPQSRKKCIFRAALKITR